MARQKKEKPKEKKEEEKEEEKKTEPVMCVSCGKNIATIKYCNSALEWTHGFVQNLCKDCYREKLLTIIETCKATLNDLDK